MKIDYIKIANNIRFQVFVGLTILLFLFKIIFSPLESSFLYLLNDLTVIAISGLLVLHFYNHSHFKKGKPLSLVMNVGIFGAIMFFMLQFSGWLLGLFFGNLEVSTPSHNIAYHIISFLFTGFFLAAAIYIFLVFKELYFLKEKKNVSTYFNTMVVFFLLATLTAFLQKEENLSFITTSLLVVSIILIVFNSIKIAWIAFIVKKEKITLLILSVVIATLFSVNIGVFDSFSPEKNIIVTFSPAIGKMLSIIMIYGAIYFTVLFFTTLFHLPTAEVFDRKAQEVSSLQYFSKLITQVLDFRELTETITDIGLKVCNADAAWIVLEKGKSREIISIKNTGYLEAETITNKILKTVGYGGLTRSKVMPLEKEKSGDPAESFSNAAIAPLKAHQSLKGHLILVKKNNFIFDQDDQDAIDTFSDYASVAIENSRLLEESIEKERLEKELDVAREVQRKIIPVKSPEYKDLTISSAFIPAFEVGGDYFDFFEIGETKLGFVIADVSGKGISAAFIMAEIKGIFESLATVENSPKHILIKANQILKRTLDRKNFISAAYGIIDTEKKILTIARAGHCPLLLIREGEAISLKPSGIGLGLNFTSYFETTLEEMQIDLEENDILVLYTDGIPEAKNHELEDFGDNNFQKILIEQYESSVDEISNKVIREVTLFSQDIPQHDDITLVIFKWKQKIKSNGVKEWQNSALQL
jgi:phosphoserine phosphatase RsbU/P